MGRLSIVVVIENVFTVHKTADTLLVLTQIFPALSLTDGLYVGVSQSAFTLVYFVVSVWEGKHTKPSPVATHNRFLLSRREH